MKNTHAWGIIAVVLVLALGVIWYMTSKVDEVPTGAETATTTATTGAKPATGGKATVSAPAPAAGAAVSSDARPKITSIAPNSGKVRTVAMIKGVNFDAKTNIITFGPSKGLHHRDGTADNQIETLPSSDGKTLTFSVPASDPDGELCDLANKCVTYGTNHIKPGTYMVTVINKDGLSNGMPFTIVE